MTGAGATALATVLPTVLAGGLAATATGLVLPAPGRHLDALARATGPGGSPEPATAAGRGSRVPVVVLGAGVVAAPSVVSLPHALLVAVAALVALVLRRRARSARLAREAARRRRSVVDFTEALAGELAAGQPVVTALARAARSWPEVAAVARAASLGADVPGAMRAVAAMPGAEGLSRLAAAWELSVTSGSALAQSSLRVLETARARQGAERLVESEAASARATARLVTVLPVVVLAAAQGAGARPLAFLTGHPAGAVCLAAGVLLWWAGTAWIDRIATAAVAGVG